MAQPFKMRHSQKLNEWHEAFPDHVWTFWANPSQAVLDQLTVVYGFATGPKSGGDEIDTAIHDYYEALSQIILDTGESQIDFSTPEAAALAFEQHDGELLTAIVDYYLVWLFERKQERLKKVEARFGATAG